MMMVKDFQNRFWVCLILTIPIVALRGMPIVQFVLSTGVYVYGGWPFLKGLAKELKRKRPGMMTLISLAISVAYAYSAAVVFGAQGSPFFWELATLIDIMLLGHWIEMKSVMGAGKALEELARLMPGEAHLVDGRDVPLEELKVGDRVVVRPGEKVPADGVVIEGESSVNEAMLTGESMPVPKGKGIKVIGGAVNGEGALTVEVQKKGKDSFLAQVIEMVRSAQESKSKAQDVANRAAMWLTVIAIGAGLITFGAWVAVGVGFALERMVTVMVITCPHALGLAVPLVIAVSTSIGAKRGLLIRNRAAFEAARNVQAVVFDKTGTLTKGEFGITDVVAFEGMGKEDLLKYAASVEAVSEHPIARAIAAGSSERLAVEGFKAAPGKGAEGRVQGKSVSVAAPEGDGRAAALAAQGKTVVMVRIDGKAVGLIALADQVRPESKEAVAKLKKMGIRCMMLTGDNAQVGKWVAEQIGLDEYFAEVLPGQKAQKVKEVQERGLTVAMVGDGVNDAPALAQADVGIAIGAGTDIAIEAADIVLVRSSPLDAVGAIALARSTYRKMVENLLWATGYNAVAIPLAAGVLYKAGVMLSPAMGAVLMSLSTVICAVNAKLLRTNNV